MLTYNLKSADTDHLAKKTTLSGLVSNKDFRNVIRSSRFLTPKEQNLLIREQTGEFVDYTKFKELVYDVRF